MVYAFLLSLLPICFSSSNSWTGNLSGNDTIPPDLRHDPGSTPRTVIDGANLSRLNSDELSMSLILGIKDMAEPESNNTFIRTPFGPIAQVYNGVVSTILIYVATTESVGGFHTRPGSPSFTAVTHDSINSSTASITFLGILTGS